MKFFVLCFTLFIISIILVLLNFNQKEHFQNSFTSLDSLSGAELDPTITLSSNVLKNSSGELVNKGKIIKAYKAGTKYKFKVDEVKKSFPHAVNGTKVSNSFMAVIIWRLANRMYRQVSEQENNIQKLEKKLSKISENLKEVKKKADKC